jgi:phosphonate transport system ATP-binding protein
MINSRRKNGCFSLDNVSVKFADLKALDNASVAVSSREVVAFIGPSGAGKTTLLKLLNGSVAPTSGTVTVDGLDVSSLAGNSLRTLRSQIGFVHQDLRLVRNLRVQQNVLSGRFGKQSFLSSLRSMIHPEQDQLLEVHRLLEMVGIPEKMYHSTATLSGGQAQRVAVARALYQQPDILLADEPVSSVDPARAQSIIKLLVGIARQENLTLGVSLHNPDLVRAHFDRVVGLRGGQVFFDKEVTEVTDLDLARLYELEQSGEG